MEKTKEKQRVCDKCGRKRERERERERVKEKLNKEREIREVIACYVSLVSAAICSSD